MSIRENLVKIEGRWSWSFFGFILAIIFGAITIYTEYIEDKNPNLEFSVESKTSVLDLKKDIKNLDILYKGINIKEENKNLSIVKIKVANNSNVSILKNYYDELSPVKLSVKNADIVDKPILISASNNYLKKNLHLELDSTGCIYLPPLILEGNESYTLSLLLLHKNASEPKLIPSGKIAGQANGIKVQLNYQASSEKNFGQKLIEGNIWVHLVRFIVYFVLFIILVIVIVVPSIYFNDKISENRKKKRVKKYKQKKKLINKPESDSVFELYLNNDAEFLFNLQKVMLDENRLRIIMRAYERRKLSRKAVLKERIEIKNSAESWTEASENFNDSIFKNRGIDYDYIASELDRCNMTKYDKGQLIVNQEFKYELNEFISYLKLI